MLKSALARRIKDREVLALLAAIIDGGPTSAGALVYFPGDDLLTPCERHRGIPIGNLSSQFFANLYLDDFDHWLKERQRVKGYVRYAVVPGTVYLSLK